ncbi:endothelin-3 [Emydura macquarii macquarii]|uniref:endothelin-3 n=1 Tax=Emydura macquarii macquarii TaxID=1129001 RepID=UPI00352B5F62
MELGFWFLFGLTVTSSAGFSPPAPRPRHLAESGRSPRSPALRERAAAESQGRAADGGLPAGDEAGRGGGKAEDGPAAAAGAPRRRAKRCTCYTYKDKECVYYCHLDIIWINTPERTVPYGLSNYRGSFRGKRSTAQLFRSSESLDWSLSRCSCLDTHDKQCMLFCTRTQDGRCNQESLKKTAEKKQRRENENALIE